MSGKNYLSDSVCWNNYERVKVMKICIWLGTISDIGGVQRLCTLLANELVKENEVTIASFDTPERLTNAVYKLDKIVKFVEFPKNKVASNIFIELCEEYYSNL